ncbi:hypothetical protein ACJ73_00682 [Blastomyces percursus]|uniref:Uncharacterized protein n=1 Tax=Blastomyces percursus TaxID=1658174 RepID=A0A1J9R6D2_9EURO|nr:hypothetical protein ACJ73_00682 [Blastomyces percursus]
MLAKQVMDWLSEIYADNHCTCRQDTILHAERAFIENLSGDDLLKTVYCFSVSGMAECELLRTASSNPSTRVEYTILDSEHRLTAAHPPRIGKFESCLCLVHPAGEVTRGQFLPVTGTSVSLFTAYYRISNATAKEPTTHPALATFWLSLASCFPIS